MEKMNKSIQLLLLISLVYLGCCSCLAWPGIALTLKQSCFYFLLLLMLLAGICTFIHYLSVHNHVSSHFRNPSRSFFLLYSSMVIINLTGVSLILFENISTETLLQKEIVDLLLISFFFLFGLDIATFSAFKQMEQIANS
ncbi:hypothetical protein QM857_02705 [Streptococcus infantis]|uniref:hypothetical protein n=1 Tax=Streptococcus infantis TaxID=68892 RepID=UPI0039C235B2